MIEFLWLLIMMFIGLAFFCLCSAFLLVVLGLDKDIKEFIRRLLYGDRK